MISVCIATYNGSQYIEEQLYSILNQISINDEIIKVNNSNRTGLLTSIDGSITNDFTLSFTVSTSDRTALYVLNNCDF